MMEWICKAWTGKDKKAIILCSRQCHEFAERDWTK